MWAGSRTVDEKLVEVTCDRACECGHFLGLFVRMTTATMMAMTMRMRMQMKKQIHRFFRAARAESTALSVCWTLHDPG